jgi:hypothetical protein
MRAMPRLRHRRINRNRVVLIAGAVGSAACLAAPGTALAGTLDQQQTDISGAASSLSAAGALTASAAQTFTAGLTGGLDQVDLAVQQNGVPTQDLTIEVQATSAGAPNGTVLATKAVSASTVIGSPTQFVPIIFPTPAPVVAGTQYAIVAYTADASGNGYMWRASNSSPDPTSYAGGGAFFAGSSPPTSWSTVTGVDQAFKTYVAPPVVSPPTPTTSAPGRTGQRAAALKKCKRKRNKQARSRCKKKANRLPV